ncbi:MAG: ABC-type uncharacterized transport system substrate-binding protein [Sulfurimonas sp.]|jgi:ABC-type uncharacterized transport system substrate-binding protein
MFLESLMRHGKKQQMWLNKFKIAIIQKDADSLNILLDKVPSFKNKEDIEQAMYLMKEGLEVLYILQDETVSSMRKIKKNINFLGTSLVDSSSSFSIKS